MKKNILKIFGIIMALFAAFIIWAVLFNDGAIVQTGYNSMVGVVNKNWETMTGNGQLVPEWGGTGAKSSGNLSDQQSGF